MKKSKGARHITLQRVLLSMLCIFLAFVLSGLAGFTFYFHHLLGLVNNGGNMSATLSPDQLIAASSDPDYNPNFSGPSVESMPQETLPNVQDDKDVINILLIGEDRKATQKYRQRSDAMILCSFNTQTKTLTMVSFLRDTYISHIPGYWSDKLNAAWQYGGAKTLNETLAAYFGIHVDANIAVQFDGFINVIDMLGGVDINLTQKEVDYMTSHNNYGWVLKKGMNHLEGRQALLYSRIREIDMDAKRAERQRKVIMAVIDAYKSKSLPEMLSLATQILETGFVETDMTAEQVMMYIREIFPIFASMNIRSQQIPAEGTYENMKVGNVVDTKVCDLDKNRKILEELFK